ETLVASRVVASFSRAERCQRRGVLPRGPTAVAARGTSRDGGRRTFSSCCWPCASLTPCLSGRSSSQTSSSSRSSPHGGLLLAGTVALGLHGYASPTPEEQKQREKKKRERQDGKERKMREVLAADIWAFCRNGSIGCGRRFTCTSLRPSTKP
ncbi:hypothetical protein H113_03542, partial [Trichophyton rubrum MR1459]